MANIIQNVNNQSALCNIQEVKYQLIDGTEVILNEQIVRNLTNNNPNITNGEIQLFVEQAKMLKVNPLINEYMIVKYDNTKPAQYILSVNAFQRVADSNEKFEGMEDGIVVQKTNGEIVERDGCIVYPQEVLLGGWARVYRKDRRVPIVVKLDIKEYSKGQSTWRQMPATMVNKCAKVACLRKAFPSLFSGMYSEEELESSGATQHNDNQPKREYDIDGVVNELPKEKGDIVVDTIATTPKTNVVNQNVVNQQSQTNYNQNYNQQQVQPNVNYNYDQNGVIVDNVNNNQNYNNNINNNQNYNNNNNVNNNVGYTQQVQQQPQQMQQQPYANQIEIPYVDYKNNKDKYEMVSNSYNAQTKTCFVILKQ